MADEQSTSATAQAKPANKAATDGRIKVRLLAKQYNQLLNPDEVFDNPRKARYKKYVKGSILNVSREEFDACNVFKPAFEEVTE